jgi:hypothetical protein
VIEKGYLVNGRTTDPRVLLHLPLCISFDAHDRYLPISCVVFGGDLRLERLGRETIVNGTLWDFQETKA